MISTNTNNVTPFQSDTNRALEERAKVLASTFRRAREISGKSQAELAKRIGCSGSLCYRLENPNCWMSRDAAGQTTDNITLPATGTVRAACVAYDIDVDFITGLAIKQRREMGLSPNKRSSIGWVKASKAATVTREPIKLKPETNGFHAAGFKPIGDIDIDRELDDIRSSLSSAFTDTQQQGVFILAAVAMSFIAVVLALVF